MNWLQNPLIIMLAMPSSGAGGDGGWTMAHDKARRGNMVRGIKKIAITAAFAVGAVPVSAASLDDVKAGVEAARQGKREEAIVLLTRAIEVPGLSTENMSIAYLNRGYAHQRNGDHGEAIDDYDEAIRLLPNSPTGYRNRASAYLEIGSYKEAVEDFAKARELSPGSAYLTLWVYMARIKAGEEAMRELRADAATIDLAAWPGPLLAFIAGRGTRKTVDEGVAMADANTRDQRRCDVAFHLGVGETMRGNREGLALLREARDKCAPESVERAVARAEILRMGR
jgi:tetratricopeptide (TPR) repeat protein